MQEIQPLGAGFRADFAPRFRAQNRAQIPGTLTSLLTNARNLGTILCPESGRKICPESGAEEPKIYPKKFKGPGIWVRFCARNPGAKSRPESGAEGLCFLNSRAPFSGAKCLRPPRIFRHYFSNLTRVSASMIMLSLSNCCSRELHLLVTYYQRGFC